MNRWTRQLITALLAVLVLAGCEPEDDKPMGDTGIDDATSDTEANDVESDVGEDTADAEEDTGPDPDRVVSVTLTPAELTMSVDQSEQLSVSATTAAGDDASTSDAVIESDEPSVVEVSSGGFAIAKSVGQANVTASLEGVSDTILVVVQPRPLESLEVVPQNRTIAVGERFEMAANSTDTSGASANDNYDVAWASGDTSILTIDDQGVITGVGEGQTTVTGSAGGMSDAANFTVEAPSVDIGGVDVTPAQANLFLGDTVQLDATITDTGGATLDSVSVGWVSSDPSVAKVDQNGVVRGVGDGSATIIASIAGVSDTSTITVDGAFTGVAAGGAHSCGIIGTTAYCWGANSRGQLGRGSTNTVGSPAAVSGGVAFKSISAGGMHTCGVSQSDDVYCWGANGSGQLGDGTTTDRQEPVKVSDIFSIVAVSAGARHTCAVDISNQLHCWGANEIGLIGDGSTGQHIEPATIAGNFEGVAAGNRHTCGFDDSGVASCWGANGQGQLGIQNTQHQTSPASVTGGFEFSVFALGAEHTCGLTSGATPACWGDNSTGQVGDGSTNDRNTPILIGISDSLSGISAGDYHTCALAAGGFVYCWGDNQLGQLGDGTSTDANEPQELPTSSSMTALSAGASHNCAIDDQGQMWCWGDGDKGQLGSGRAVERSPIRVNIN
jgi:alpha-tubulin suppressor-like RCC1 family protein